MGFIMSTPRHRKTKRCLLLAALWLGLACVSSGLAAETNTVASFEQGLAKCLALEEAGEFAGAMQSCADLTSRFASHPDVGNAQKLLAKLKQEKRAALQLSFAIEKLASDAPGDRQVANEQLMDTPEVGVILLRQNVRKSSLKDVVASIALLQEIGDAKAILAYADRLKGTPPGSLAETLVQAIEDRSPLADLQERDALDESLGALIEVIANDATFEHRHAVGLLLQHLTTRFHGQSQAVDAFLKKPGAFDALKSYVRRADLSTDKEVAAWALARFATVGLSRFGGQVVPAGAFDTWSRKMKISFPGYNKPEVLINFPALVVLSTNISGFDYGDFLSGSNADLRFTDASGTTALNYEIESWNAKGRSYVWVQVPSLASPQDCIYACWGKRGVDASLHTTNGATWADGYLGVWHLRDGSVLNLQDSSTNGWNGTNSGATATAGIAGGAANFNGSASIAIGNLGALPSNGTIEFWMKPDVVENYHNPMTTRYNGGNTGFRWEVCDGGVFGVVAGNDSGTYDAVAYFQSGLRASSWHAIVYAWDTVNNREQAFLDGTSVADQQHTLWPASIPDLRFGTGFSTDPGRQWKGSLEEVRISTSIRSANWLWATYLNMASNSAFNTCEMVRR